MSEPDPLFPLKADMANPLVDDPGPQRMFKKDFIPPHQASPVGLLLSKSPFHK